MESAQAVASVALDVLSVASLVAAVVILALTVAERSSRVFRVARAAMPFVAAGCVANTLASSAPVGVRIAAAFAALTAIQAWSFALAMPVPLTQLAEAIERDGEAAWWPEFERELARLGERPE